MVSRGQTSVIDSACNSTNPVCFNTSTEQMTEMSQRRKNKLLSPITTQPVSHNSFPRNTTSRSWASHSKHQRANSHRTASLNIKVLRFNFTDNLSTTQVVRRDVTHQIITWRCFINDLEPSGPNVGCTAHREEIWFFKEGIHADWQCLGPKLVQTKISAF